MYFVLLAIMIAAMCGDFYQTYKGDFEMRHFEETNIYEVIK